MAKGITGRLRKLLALSRDERGNPHVREQARQKFLDTCQRHSIDPETITPEDFGLGDDMVCADLDLPEQINMEVRMICGMVAELWRSNVVGFHGKVGGCKIVFATRRPERPDESKAAFDWIYWQFRDCWNQERKKGLSKSRKSFCAGFLSSIHSQIQFGMTMRQAFKALEAAKHTIRQPRKRRVEKPNPLALVTTRPAPRFQESQPAPPPAVDEQPAPPPDLNGEADPEPKPFTKEDVCQTSYTRGVAVGMRLDAGVLLQRSM